MLSYFAAAVIDIASPWLDERCVEWRSFLEDSINTPMGLYNLWSKEEKALYLLD